MKMEDRLRDLRREFEIDSKKVIEIANLFKLDMENGLIGAESPLKMLPSFIGRPSGMETGVFYTFDMGGTNIRSAKYELENGKYKKLDEVKNKLRDPEKRYDYTTENVNAEQLFDFFAELIVRITEPDKAGFLGHTFSFPVRQSELNEATLIEWTKEIKVSGVIDQNPNMLLASALQRKNSLIKPIALINDTVATLLVGAYSFKNADVGTILGTGYNSCYLEANHPINSGEMIVNMETGNFKNGLPVTKYDAQVDINSISPGRQSLEKMVSGSYLGSIVEQIIYDFHDNYDLFTSCEDSVDLLKQKILDSVMTADFILDPKRTTESIHCTMEDALVLKEIAQIIVRRAVRLATATYIGTLMHIDSGEINKSHVMSMDGALYEKMPRVPELMRETLEEVLGDRAKLITVKYLKDGSGVGAAIAAAIAMKTI